jgi:hypothetical protein
VLHCNFPGCSFETVYVSSLKRHSLTHSQAEKEEDERGQSYFWEKLEFSRMLTTLNGTSIGRKKTLKKLVDVTLIKYVTRLHVSFFEK